VIAARDLYCCLLPQGEALRTWRWGSSIATISSHGEDLLFTKSISDYVSGTKCFVLYSGDVKQTYCANCDESMKYFTVFLYIVKFIFRCGVILHWIFDDLEMSMTLDDENIPFWANCDNTIFSNLA